MASLIRCAMGSRLRGNDGVTHVIVSKQAGNHGVLEQMRYGFPSAREVISANGGNDGVTIVIRAKHSIIAVEANHELICCIGAK